jgi:hypothetical protein
MTTDILFYLLVFKHELESKIKTETKGDYQEVLLALFNGNKNLAQKPHTKGARASANVRI